MNVTMMNGSEDRTQRSRSAPPAPVVGNVPQKTFVSTMNYEPNTPAHTLPQSQQQQSPQQGAKVIPIIREAGSNSSKNSSPQPNRPQPNQQHQDRQQPDSSGSGVRIIPIHVEGRDKPVIAQQQQQSSGKQKGSRPPGDENDGRKCSSPNQTPPMKKPTLPVSPLDVIQQTRNEVAELEKAVDQAAGGSRLERAYAELEEILTRKLLQLDNIDTEGRDDIRQARKDCIKYILSCLAKLEAKYPPTPAQAAAENTCMELELAHPLNDAPKTDMDVVAVQQPLAEMAVENQGKPNGNNNAIQPTAIPLMPPPEDKSAEPKKSPSQTQVVSMEVTLATPNEGTNNAN